MPKNEHFVWPKIFIMFFILLPNALAQQADTAGLSTYRSDIVSNGITRETQNWETDKRSFPEGVYYVFQRPVEYKDGKRSVSSMIGVPAEREMMLGFLIAKGVPVKEMWYKPGESSCRVGEQISLPAVVEPALVIRTEKSMDEKMMNSLGFVRQDHPALGWCPIHVEHYTLR